MVMRDVNSVGCRQAMTKSGIHTKLYDLAARGSTAEKRRARIVIMSIDGQKAAAIARETGASAPTVRQVIDRYSADGISGIKDAKPGDKTLSASELQNGQFWEMATELDGIVIEEQQGAVNAILSLLGGSSFDQARARRGLTLKALQEWWSAFKKLGAKAFMVLPEHWDAENLQRDAERDPEQYSANVTRAVADLYRGEKLDDVLHRYSIPQRSITVKIRHLEKLRPKGADSSPFSSDNSATRQWKLKTLRGQLLKTAIKKSGKPELEVVVEALEGLLATKYGEVVEEKDSGLQVIPFIRAAKAAGNFFDVAGSLPRRELIAAAETIRMRLKAESSDDEILMSLYLAIQ